MMISKFWSEVRYRLRAILRRADVERELDDELRFHLEHETDKLVRAGLSRDEAARLARVSFGGLNRIKDDTRDAHGVALLDIIAQDTRYALRGLRHTPGFTAAVVVTLALGIGANAAMFGVVDRLMIRQPAFLIEPQTVHRAYLSYDFRGDRTVDQSIEYRRYLDLRQWTSSFSQIAAFSMNAMAVGTGADAVELPVGRASASLFDFFNARPVIGRFYGAQDDSLPRGAAVAVLGYGYWQAQYGARADVLGARIQIGSGTYTIIGVAPEGFAGFANDAPAVAWVPATAYAALQRATFYNGYNWGWLNVVARRKPGVTVAAATADMTHAYRLSWLAERALDPSLSTVDAAHPHVILAPTQVDRGPNAGPAARVALWVSGVALMALLVACANVANLLLARAFRRRREIAVRQAMGVGRARLLAQLLTESLILALFGGAAGLFVARAGGAALSRLLALDASQGGTLADTRTILFCGTLTLLVGLVTGLAPALHARTNDVIGALRAGSREGSYQRSRLRAALVVLQGALSTALLIGAGLFMRSLQHVRAVPLGYDVDPIVLVERNMRGVKLASADEHALMQRLEDEAAHTPGVASATQMVSTPFYSFESTGLYVAGVDSIRKLGRFQLQIASPSFFRTVGTRIVAGRGIETQDRENAPKVIVVSAEMARRIWPGRNALGQCVRVGADTAPCSTVVGISEDTKQRQISHDAESSYYVAADQVTRATSGLYVRVNGRANDYVDIVRRRLQSVMPGASYVTALPFSDIVGDKERSWQVGATMFAALGGLALLLASIGLYSVIAYSVAQRSHELGLRIALGARANNLVALVLGEGVRFGFAGIAIGSAIALLAGRSMSSLLFDESPRDPIVFGVVLVTLLGVALAACVIPALRAARVDPNVALRAD